MFALCELDAYLHFAGQEQVAKDRSHAIMFKSSREARVSLVRLRENCMIHVDRLGSGLWMPDAEPLSLLRRNIDRKPRKWRQVLTEAQLRRQILGVATNDEAKALKAFAMQNKENALKTRPKASQARIPYPSTRSSTGRGLLVLLSRSCGT
jgi:uncharacterized protein (DUF2461 family)